MSRRSTAGPPIKNRRLPAFTPSSDFCDLRRASATGVTLMAAGF